MPFFCHDCLKPVELLLDNACFDCGGFGVEGVSAGASVPPAEPFIIPNSQTMEGSTSGRPSPVLSTIFGSGDNFDEDLFLFLMHTLPRLTRTGFDLMTSVIIIIAGDEQAQKTISEAEFNALPKVNQLGRECSICQEAGGSGLELGCKHQFHGECLRPWLKTANTCPCCRATVAE